MQTPPRIGLGWEKYFWEINSEEKLGVRRGVGGKDGKLKLRESLRGLWGNRGVNHGGKEEEWKETHIQELLKKKGLRKKGEEERTQGLSA